METRRFVRMFKPQFAEMVRTGAKRQTVRPLPWRMPRAGDVIDCRMWSEKPYRSKQVKLCEVAIEQVVLIHIREDGLCINGLADGQMLKTEYPLQKEEMDRFAKADGFSDWAELAKWFQATHGLPFEGVMIRWRIVPGESSAE